MKQKTFLKAATLFFSLSLVTAFILYRTGRFDSPSAPIQNSIQQSSNGSVIKQHKKDTVAKPQPDSLKKLWLSSSKSVVITDRAKPIYFQKKEVPLLKQLVKKYSLDSSSIKKPPVFFSGSKSGHIFTPTLLIDSIKKIKQ